MVILPTFRASTNYGGNCRLSRWRGLSFVAIASEIGKRHTEQENQHLRDPVIHLHTHREVYRHRQLRTGANI